MWPSGPGPGGPSHSGSSVWAECSSRRDGPSQALPQGCQPHALPPGVFAERPAEAVPMPCSPMPPCLPAVHVQHESQIPRHEPASPRLQRQRPLDRQAGQSPMCQPPCPPQASTAAPTSLKASSQALPAPSCRSLQFPAGTPATCLDTWEHCHRTSRPHALCPPRVQVHRALLQATQPALHPWPSPAARGPSNPAASTSQHPPPLRSPDALGHSVPWRQCLLAPLCSVSLLLSHPDSRPLPSAA